MRVVRSLVNFFHSPVFVLTFVLLAGAAWAQQPHQEQCLIDFGPGISSGECSFQRVPAGKILEIQEFDAEGWLETGVNAVEIRLYTREFWDHVFTATFMGTRYYDFYATHQETHLYVEADHRPVCSVLLSGADSGADLFYFCHLSGVLENAP